MIYLGSKNSIAKHILPIILEKAQQNGITTWVEPFVGGANMIDKVPSHFKRIGYDLNPHSIAALTAIRDFVTELPTSLTEQEYKTIKGGEPSPINSWLRFVASFGGKLDNGYAREHRSGENAHTTFVRRGRENAKKQSPLIQNVDFFVGDYNLCSNFTNCVIYCDPPYQGTTNYKTGKFDHDKFWDWVRIMSKTNLVYVSEYNAPDDFECVWQMEKKVNFASQHSEATTINVEKLFVLK